MTIGAYYPEAWTAVAEDEGVDFRARIEELNEELETLNAEAAVLQGRIAANVAGLIG